MVRRFLLPLLLVSFLPISLSSSLWLEVWQGSRAQAWDGSGHYALAGIYNESIFPDTFGWTNGYFAGIGFPNFYPPLFYFLVALLRHTHLLSFDAAFKIVLVLPELLLPAMIWWLAYRLFGKDRLAATCAGVALLPLLVDERFTNSTGVIGLSYTSTFLLGLYTQPLGFVLLIAWFVSYLCPTAFGLPPSAGKAEETQRKADACRTLRRVALSAGLLALALLGNFFSSNVALLMIISVLAWDTLRVVNGQMGKALPSKTHPLMQTALTGRYRNLIAHLLIPTLALGLMMFWLGPLASSYRYVVTRPVHTPVAELVPAIIWPWYALAALGSYLWLRREKKGFHIPFLVMCGLLFCEILFGGTIAPRWFPFQANRLTSALNFLLAVPVGELFASGLRVLGFGRKGQSAKRKGQRLRSALTMAIVLAFAALPVVALISATRSGWAYYDKAEWSRIAPVLQFGAEHRDGRYLVENVPFADVDNAHDARAINAYLGAQGNEVLSLFFREAAPNVLFLNPLVDSLSASKDTYGISSTLTDDTEYAKEPLEQHLAQARLFGTKYIVVHSDLMKGKLAAVSGISRNDVGRWTVFDLGGGSQPPVSTPANKPALVVADLTFKTRRTNGYDFVHFAEEQFASGWYDVLLARSPEMNLNRLDISPGFGALIVAAYGYHNQERAFASLKEFSQTRPLLLLSDPDPLFQKIKASAAEFPQLEIIERPQEGPGEWIESDRATRSYAESGPHRVWQEVTKILERKKVAVPSVAIDSNIAQQTITAAPASSLTESVPVLISTTFHPNWQRADGGVVYPITPFFMLTFVREPTRLVFARRAADYISMLVSLTTFVSLAGIAAWSIAGDRKPNIKAPNE